jgi:hypothetical protein
MFVPRFLVILQMLLSFVRKDEAVDETADPSGGISLAQRLFHRLPSDEFTSLNGSSSAKMQAVDALLKGVDADGDGQVAKMK